MYGVLVITHDFMIFIRNFLFDYVMLLSVYITYFSTMGCILYFLTDVK